MTTYTYSISSRKHGELGEWTVTIPDPGEAVAAMVAQNFADEYDVDVAALVVTQVAVSTEEDA